MPVLSISIVDQTFDKKSAEIAYLLKVLDIIGTELERGRGITTSGTVLGNNAAGTPNTSLGSWTYTPSASNP